MSAGIWQDQQVRRANEKAGWKLCGRCEGTGNELYSMYRACQECGGSGQVGDPPLKLRLSRWYREKRWAIRELRRDDNWKGLLHWSLSYYLGIGEWFHDRRDRCRHCDAMPSDIDHEMRRVGPFRAECVDRKACDEVVREYRDLEEGK